MAQQQLECAIVWFRRDLRTYDNPALVAALNSAKRVIPVYVWAPEEEVRRLAWRCPRITSGLGCCASRASEVQHWRPGHVCAYLPSRYRVRLAVCG